MSLPRVAHLTHNLQGGAGRAALRTRDACRAAGMVSELFCLDGAEEGDGVIQPKWLRKAPDAPSRLHEFMFHKLQWNDIFQHRRGPSNTLLSQPYPGMAVSQLAALQAFDLLHLHWATWTVTPPDIRAWLESGRALVWTLHDAWPMTGGCHYPSGCEQYRSECVVCPQLSDAYSLVPNAFADKLHQYGNDPRLQVVAPSPWLAAEARRSRIFRGTPVHEVSNAIDLDVFSPAEAARAALRADLGFAPEDFVMLFGNHLNDEVRKGGQVLSEALAMLLKGPAEGLQAWAEKTVRPAFLTFGTPFDLGAATRGVKTLAIDSVKDDALLADLYRVADVLCFPSLEDNCPNTLVEAMACGTPAIVFGTGGMASMVSQGHTGLVVGEVGSAAAFAQAIHHFALHHFQDQGMREACRAAAEARHEPAKVGAQLASVYRAALQAAGRELTAPSSRDGQGGSTGLSPSAKAIHQHATVKVSPRVGADFFRYPVNRRVARLAEQPAEAVLSEALAGLEGDSPEGAAWLAPSPVAEGRVSVALVSSLHAHHASYAGPYQFCRHLEPNRFELRHYRTPLGGGLLSPAAAARARDFGRALGLEGYAQQPNAMLAEFDLLADQTQRRDGVVHFLDGELCGWLYPRAARRLLGRAAPAVVMSLHQPPEILERMVSRERLSEVDVLLALCESQAEFLRAEVPGVAVRVVPHGVSTEYFRPGPRAREFVSTSASRPLRLLSVGHWLRDYPMALAAVQRLEALGVPCEHTIVCHNFPEELDLPKASRIVSGLPDEALLELYAWADALLLPLTAATANNAILEAMACGLPVFSAQVGGVAEMVAGAAFLAPAGDAEALAAGLLQAAGAPEWRVALSERGLARAAELSWARVAAQFAAVYEEAMVLAGARHAAA